MRPRHEAVENPAWHDPQKSKRLRFNEATARGRGKRADRFYRPAAPALLQ